MRERDIDEFIDSRLIICNLCRKELNSDSNYCLRCSIHRLANIAFDYDNNINKKNINEEDTYTSLKTLEDIIPYKDEWKYEHYRLYKKAGIFGIYVNNKLYYIGKSKNIFVNWLFMTQTIINKDIKGRALFYSWLIDEYLIGSNIGFEVIEFCYDLEKLDDMKEKWINHYKPFLNKTE